MIKLHEYLNSSASNKIKNNNDQELWSILLNQSRSSMRKSSKRLYSPRTFYKMTTRKINDGKPKAPIIKRCSIMEKGVEDLK